METNGSEKVKKKNRKKYKTKRGGKKYKHENLTIFSTNSAGLKAKLESFKSELK